MEWRIYDDRVMLLSGIGSTGNYNNSKRPWAEYEDSFSDVVVGEGITKLGDRTFYAYKKYSRALLFRIRLNISEQAFSLIAPLSPK